jgi:hypothetical protein
MCAKVDTHKPKHHRFTSAAFSNREKERGRDRGSGSERDERREENVRETGVLAANSKRTGHI